MTAVKLLFILYRHSGGSRNPENGRSIEKQPLTVNTGINENKLPDPTIIWAFISSTIT